MLASVALSLAIAPAVASARAPWWHIGATLQPAVLQPGAEGTIVLQVENIGTAPSTGAETIRDVLPAGYTVVESEGAPQVSFFIFSFEEGKLDLGPGSFLGSIFHACEVSGSTIACTPPEELGVGVVREYEYMEVRIKVKAPLGSGGAQNAVHVSGGAPPAAVTQTLSVDPAGFAFGVEQFSMVPEEEGGAVDSHAGTHPAQVTSTLAFNQSADLAAPPALVRGVHLELPPGFLGNVNATPQCNPLDFQHVVNGGSANLCPVNSAIGAALVTIDEPHSFHVVTFPVPVFNLEPKTGEPARFGFELVKTPVVLDTSLRTGRDYGVNVDVSDVSQLANVISSTVTLWGVPNDPSHNESRGWGCLVAGYWAKQAGQPCVPSVESHPLPFLSLPTSCEAPFAPTVEALSWPTNANPSGITSPRVSAPLADAFGRPLGLDGCNHLAFAPTLVVTPESQLANSPSGMTVHVRMPQEGAQNAEGVVSSAIRSTAVTLPDGVAVNPSAAGGLAACSESEVGFEMIDTTQTALFTPDLPTPFCPDASKIGTVKLKVPILSGVLEGGVYLADQGANPFGSLLAMYIVADNPELGVRVKLAGEVQLAADGQISTSLINTPQAPIEEAEFKFFGGPHAALSTPTGCGTYTTRAVFTPWSGGAPVSTTSDFSITAAPSGGPCESSRGFAPKLHAGSGSLKAGAFSPLETIISRGDSDQSLSGLQLHLPPGLAAVIASTVPCAEGDANAGTCGSQSLIGHSTAWVGVGSEPYEVRGGEVFITGPYRGAPFGLSIVTPAKAGPFDLGKVVVRAKLDVDRRTAGVTVTTDSTPPYDIPEFVKGIPLDIRRIAVAVDRPGFSFNPTNCSSTSVAATLTGFEGAKASVSAPFQVANCANLKFDPKIAVRTNRHATKANGASLVAKVVYPKTSQGIESNITKVKVDLPKKLPSRLTTLQKACLASVFEANAANCPHASVVGHARVVTPLLPVPLTGPAYLVSHGGEAFPSLTVVLQGDNVTFELVGSTLIKNGITSTTFKTVPDVPFTEFELVLPQGPFSALTAFGNLCKGKLLMPTAFYGQNGAEIHENTQISVAGCKQKAVRHAPARRHRKSRKG